MHFTAAAVASLFATAALAAPAPAQAKSMMAAGTWTITSLKRTCSADDTSCTWEFGIDTHSGAAATPCKFAVSGHPASTTGLSAPAQCGGYSVTTGWSGQFGPGNGFTTLSVVDNAARLIVWPAYTDAQLKNGVVVAPDQSYTPQSLP